jgi:hypothetical protein
MKLRHAAALALLVVAAGSESQANQEYRAERSSRRNPPKLTTTASVLTAPQSSPGWLLIVPPEEPRPLGASRAMTEAPLSQWLVKGTYPTQSDSDNVLHPKAKPSASGVLATAADSTGKLVTSPFSSTSPQIIIGPFSTVYGPPHHPPPSGAQCIASDDPRLAR